MSSRGAPRSLAERAGHADPQRCSGCCVARSGTPTRRGDDIRAWLVEHLGHRDGVLIADETGFLKKGLRSVGVQRQYTGTAGRVENSQVAVFLDHASPAGRALIDRRLYLPDTAWCVLPQRRERAGVPAEVDFSTKHGRR